MRRLRKISSVLGADRKNQRLVVNDAFTQLPPEVHGALVRYLTPPEIQRLCLVNRALFDRYVGFYWRWINVKSTNQLLWLNKLAKLVAGRKTYADYFVHVQMLAIDLFQEMDREKEIAKLISLLAPHLRRMSLNIGAAWGDQIETAITTLLPKTAIVNLGVSMRRLISLETANLPHVRTLHLKLDYGNIGWLNQLGRNVESLWVEPDDTAKRQLRFKDVDLLRTLSTARYLKQVKFDWVCIISDGATSWLPPSVMDLTLTRCNFEILCYEDDEEAQLNDEEEVPVAENVTNLTLEGACSDQVFMMFPRLHTLSLFRNDNSAPLKFSPVDSADMENLQCINFSGYSYMDVLHVVTSSHKRLPATTLKVYNVPANNWMPMRGADGYQEVLEQLPNLRRLYLDCKPLIFEDVPFSIQMRAALTELMAEHRGPELVFDFGDADKFLQHLFAGGVDIELEETFEPPLQRVVSVQNEPLKGIVMAK